MAITEQEIEGAARRLCVIRGIEPDGLVGHGAEPNAQGFAPAVWLQSPAWRLVVREIEAHLQMVEALTPPERGPLTVFGTPTMQEF